MTPAADGIKAAIDLGQKLVEENGWFMPMQFENPANLKAHELTTGPEIIEAFGENGLDAFVACAGTGVQFLAFLTILKVKILKSKLLLSNRQNHQF